MADAIQVSDASFDNEVINSDLPALVDCWAPWCMPCNMVGPIVEEIASEYKGKVKVCKLQVDENPDCTTKYGIRSIPTLLIFKEGKVVDQIVGVVPKETISSKLDSVI